MEYISSPTNHMLFEAHTTAYDCCTPLQCVQNTKYNDKLHQEADRNDLLKQTWNCQLITCRMSVEGYNKNSIAIAAEG